MSAVVRQVAPLLAAAPGCAIVPLDRRAELFDERVQEVRLTMLLAQCTTLVVLLLMC
jgi:hypothetical protein